MRLLILFASLNLWAGGVLDRQLPLENNRANQLFEEKNYEEALKAYLDLYGQDTENGALAYNIANTYAAMAEPEKAREFYQKALKSKHPEARDRAKFNMGNLEMASNQLQQAVRQYIDYLQAHPEDVDAKRNLEIALRQMEQQQQQQQNQDQNQQEQQDQEQQQNQNGQQGQQDQKQEQQQDQDQESQQDQQQQDQQQNQDQDEKGGQTPPEEKNREQEQQQQQSEQSKEGELNEAMKEQILEALNEQELQQQKEFQKRKVGRIKRRAKDW